MYCLDILEILTNISIGREIDFIGKKNNDVAGIIFLNVQEYGKIKSIPNISSITDGNEIEASLYAKEGDVIFEDELSSTSRLGHIIHVSDESLETAKNTFFENLVIEAPVFSAKSSDDSDRLYFFQASISDVDSLYDLEKETWSESQAASKNVIRTRIELNPLSTIYAFSRNLNRIVGAIVWVRINPKNLNRSWNYYSDLLNSKEGEGSNTGYVVSITSSPYSPRGTGTALFNALRHLGNNAYGLECFYSGVRSPSYFKNKNVYPDYSAYIEAVLANKVEEPAIGASLKSKGQVSSLLYDYYDDPESGNNAVLIKHNAENFSNPKDGVHE